MVISFFRSRSFISEENRDLSNAGRNVANSRPNSRGRLLIVRFILYENK